MENWSKHTEQEMNKVIETQAYIDKIADLKYQCFYLKCTEKEFWGKYLWKKKKNSQKPTQNPSKPISEAGVE